HIHSAPSTRTHDAELDAHAPSGFDDAGEVLPRLERPDGEEVVALRHVVTWTEDRIDAVRDHANAVGGPTGKREDLVLRELGGGDGRVCAGQYRKEPCLPVEPVPAGKRLRPAHQGEVVDGDDERDARPWRAAKGGAVQDVQAASPPPQPDRIPPDVADDAR